MKRSFLRIGLFAQCCNLILGPTAAAQPEIEPDAVRTPWTGEMGVRQSTAQLMVREQQIAAETHVQFLRWRTRAAKQTDSPEPDSSATARWFPGGPLAGSPVPFDSPIS